MALSTGTSCNLYIACHTDDAFKAPIPLGLGRVGEGWDQADSFPRKHAGREILLKNNHGGPQFPWATSGSGNQAESTV